MASLVRSLGFRARAYASADDFLGASGRTRASCVIADVRMPGMDGVGLLRALRASPPAPPVILITAFADAALHREAAAGGAHCVLEKPFEEDTMIGCLHDALAAGGAPGEPPASGQG
jgi:FixJ family two-component response regulator